MNHETKPDPAANRSLSQEPLPANATSSDAAGGDALPGAIRQKVRLSWLAVAVTRFWPALWPSTGIVGVFLALALMNVFSVMPGWLHGLVLAGFAGLLVTSILWPIRGQRWPTRGNALRHLETSSGLDHRPISSFEDRMGLAPEDKTAKALWLAHRKQMITRIRNLKIEWPRLDFSARDPFALRMLVLIVVIASAIAAGTDGPTRILAALDPTRTQGLANARFDVWITPPPYTAEQQRSLPQTALGVQTPVVRVPEGSILSVRVHAGSGMPSLRTGPLASSIPDPQPQDFRDVGDGAQEAKVTLSRSLHARMSLGGLPAGHWRFEAIPDRAPTIAFKTDLAVMHSRTLRFHYAVSDDYGVASATAKITLADPGTASSGPKEITFELPLPPQPARAGDSTVFKDLTAHRWAGLPALVSLTAVDGRDQAATSAQTKITLPERPFANPFARALIEQRRILVRDPASAAKVARALQALSIAPERFARSASIYLPLRAVYFRVFRAKDAADLLSAEEMLWQLALKVEEGDTPAAQAEVRRLQQKLADALARGASEAEIAALMQQLRGAIQRLVQAMQAQPSNPNTMAPAGAQELRGQDLKSMLDQIETLARAGSAEAAREMLNRLQSMLENVAPMAQQSAGEQAGQKLMDQLSNLVSQQRALMDKTVRQGNESQSSAPTAAGQQLAQEQMALSNKVNQLMKEMGQLPGGQEALKQAQSSMAAAAQNIGEGQFGNAGENQQAALEQLRRGGSAMLRALQSQAAQKGGQMQGSGIGAGENEDPFGRPQSTFGPSSGNSVKVPSKADIQRTREILEELQRRASQRERPVPELDYIDRLLRRF